MFERAIEAGKDLLEPGATFVGNFTLPVHAGSMDVTIRSAAMDSQLPPAGTRISPAWADVLPKLRSSNSQPVIATLPGAESATTWEPEPGRVYSWERAPV